MRANPALLVIVLAACGTFEVDGNWSADDGYPERPGPKAPPTHEKTPEETPTETPPPQLVFNEVYSSWQGGGFDADASRDGIVDASDQFVEILNVSGAPFSLAGVEIWEAHETTPRVVFPGGTLGTGRGILVFGGSASVITETMCSVTIAMTNAPLRFDATDRVVLRREGMILDEVAWTAAPPSGVSLTRSPDRTGPFAFHATTTDSQGVMRRLSPGCKTDSTPF